MGDEKVIGIDLGGTRIKAVLMDRNKRVLVRTCVKTPQGRNHILNALARLIKTFKKHDDVHAVGIACAGPMDKQRTKLLQPPNLAPMGGFRFKRKLALLSGVSKILLENDANCAAIAEHMLGKARGCKNFVLLTMGTGIGSAIFVDNMLLRGAHGVAAEWGHAKVAGKPFKCNCGRYGCLEAIVGSYGIMRLAQARGISVSSPKELYILAKRGNKQAVETFKDAAYYLGIALSNIVNALDPEKIIMAGGIANAWEFMEREAVTTMNRNLLIKNMGVKVEKSDMNDYAGAIGAALLASAPNKALGLKPRIAVDLVILHYTRGRFDGIVLVERKYRPYGWAFPGGMLEYGETLEDAAKREALEETGLHIELLEHFKPYSAPRRDPRHHTVGVVFIARASGKPKPGSDAKDVKIFSLSHIPKLAFDHNRILHDVVKYLRRKYAITL